MFKKMILKNKRNETNIYQGNHSFQDDLITHASNFFLHFSSIYLVKIKKKFIEKLFRKLHDLC